jgi:hypothetical protein
LEALRRAKRHAMVFAIVFSAFGKSTMRAMLDQYASLIHPFEVWNICGAATPGDHRAFTIGGGFHRPVSASDFGA